MNQLTTADDIKSLGTILSVWAHPDDESFTAGGVLTTAVSNGQKVICVTATRGEAGIQDESRWPADKLGQIRTQELQQALALLGITEHHWLNYKDGRCQEEGLDQGIDKIEHFINKYKPDTILTFGPDGLTGHPDHQSVSFWVRGAVAGKKIAVYHVVEEELNYIENMQQADKKINIYFNIDKPPVYKMDQCDIAYILPKDVLAKKRTALKAMPSQTESMFKKLDKSAVDKMLSQECFILAK